MFSFCQEKRKKKKEKNPMYLDEWTTVIAYR